MKRILLFLIATTVFAGMAPLGAQTTEAPATGPEVEICKMDSATAVEEYQRNVAIVKAQRAQAKKLQAELDGATNNAIKGVLRDELADVMKKLDENHDKMVATYGFSLNRNYRFEVSEMGLYVGGIRRGTFKEQAFLDAIEQSRTLIAAQESAVTAAQTKYSSAGFLGKKRAKRELEDATAALARLKTEVTAKHGFDPLLDYTVKIEKGVLYMYVTPEEKKRYEAAAAR